MSRNAFGRALAATAVAVAIPVVAVTTTAVGTAGGRWLASPGLPAARLASVRTSVGHPLVIKIAGTPYGRILATPRKLALYVFGPERADHRIHCVGSCASAWPPVLVPHTLKVSAHIAGITGTFGTIRRPNRSIQLTRNKLPLYTFAFDVPGQVTGNGVAGFTVVRG